MAVIDIKLDPTRKDLRIFALMWIGFFLLLGFMAEGKPRSLLVAAMVTAAAFLVSISFNKDQPRKLQAMGVLIPLALVVIGGLERLGVPAGAVALLVWAAGLIGGVAALASPQAGKELYVGWMYAALPLGWTFSHLMLGAVYYLVFTPIGLTMRALGRDPMQRRFDPQMSTYWIARPAVQDRSRYFKQF